MLTDNRLTTYDDINRLGRNRILSVATLRALSRSSLLDHPNRKKCCRFCRLLVEFLRPPVKPTHLNPMLSGEPAKRLPA
jgi:hypothetical protein